MGTAALWRAARFVVAVVAAAGCSASSAVPGPQPEVPREPASPRDAALAVAQPVDAAAPADEDSATFLANWHYTFDWQARRDEYTALYHRTGPRDDCDANYRNHETTVDCPGPHEIAGMASRSSGGNSVGTAIVNIDRGSDDFVTTNWTVALLDDDGTPVTPWLPLMRIDGDHQSSVEFATEVFFAQHHRHVGMRIYQQLLQRIRLLEQRPVGDIVP